MYLRTLPAANGTPTGRWSWCGPSRRPRRGGRAWDALAGDIESGKVRVPRCDAEAVVMRRAISEAQKWLAELDEDELAQESLPEHGDDYDWDGCAGVLLRGGGEPGAAWFEWFGGAAIPRSEE